jgi:heme/copper-type cytochrome/quinol oxidase subunit 1
MDDLTNRIMALAFAFLWIFAIFIVILLVWSSPDESINRIRDLAGYLDDHNNTETQLVITFGGVILILVAVLLIIFELVPQESKSLKIQQIRSGGVEISTEEVILKLEDGLRALPQIEDAQATIVGRGKKAEVDLSLHVTPDANLTSTADAACQRVSDLLENQMGIALAKAPSAEVHYRELQVSSNPVSPPATSPGLSGPPTTDQPESMDATRDDPTAGS